MGERAASDVKLKGAFLRVCVSVNKPFFCVCVCVYVYVCMYVCVCVCMKERVFLC